MNIKIIETKIMANLKTILKVKFDINSNIVNIYINEDFLENDRELFNKKDFLITFDEGYIHRDKVKEILIDNKEFRTEINKYAEKVFCLA